MRITQHDVAQLDTDSLKAIVVGLAARTSEAAPGGGFWLAMQHALIRAIKERRRLELLAEADLMNDDGPGALVSPDDDPIGDALGVMRGEPL